MTSAQSPLLFYIFGHNISHSLSPALHNSGFKEIGFPGYYSVYESPQVDDGVESIIRQTNFRGASVTFPHKLQVAHLVQEITPAAEAVGAINTLIVKSAKDGHRIIVGDNTDWLGIRTCILGACQPAMIDSSALVWGAGGAARAACYALQTAGIRQVSIVNRSEQRSKHMAEHFPDLNISIFSNLPEAQAAAQAPIRIVVCCIPADNILESQIPDSLFSAVPSGTLVEMAYRPPITAIMKTAARYPNWAVFNGMDVLKEQAFAQFQLWTGSAAPKDVMSAAMQDAREKQHQ